MNPGKLNKRIEFVLKENKIDDSGFAVENIKTYKKCWASIRGLRGREFYSAKAVNAEDNKVFNCRYFKGLTPKMFIKYKRKIYNIISVNNLNERNVEYEIHAKEVEKSG